MDVDSSLNELKLWLCDCPSSDGNRQHFHHISERKRGRQPKMMVNRKKFDLNEFGPEFGPILGLAVEVRL